MATPDEVRAAFDLHNQKVKEAKAKFDQTVKEAQNQYDQVVKDSEITYKQTLRRYFLACMGKPRVFRDREVSKRMADQHFKILEAHRRCHSLKEEIELEVIRHFIGGYFRVESYLNPIKKS